MRKPFITQFVRAGSSDLTFKFACPYSSHASHLNQIRHDQSGPCLSHKDSSFITKIDFQPGLPWNANSGFRTIKIKFRRRISDTNKSSDLPFRRLSVEVLPKHSELGRIHIIVRRLEP